VEDDEDGSEEEIIPMPPLPSLPSSQRDEEDGKKSLNYHNSHLGYDRRYAVQYPPRSLIPTPFRDQLEILIKQHSTKLLQYICELHENLNDHDDAAEYFIDRFLCIIYNMANFFPIVQFGCHPDDHLILGVVHAVYASEFQKVQEMLRQSTISLWLFNQFLSESDRVRVSHPKYELNDDCLQSLCLVICEFFDVGLHLGDTQRNYSEKVIDQNLMEVVHRQLSRSTTNTKPIKAIKEFLGIGDCNVKFGHSRIAMFRNLIGITPEEGKNHSHEYFLWRWNYMLLNVVQLSVSYRLYVIY
jgi:hypothetical protein